MRTCVQNTSQNNNTSKQQGTGNLCTARMGPLRHRSGRQIILLAALLALLAARAAHSTTQEHPRNYNSLMQGKQALHVIGCAELSRCFAVVVQQA